jgi:hypothetical protein
MMALIFLGCSAPHPVLSDANITSENTVPGQRILLQVNAITDNPPMTYQWSATGGTLEVQDFFPFGALWIAPEQPGTYTITCLITDKQKKHQSHTFTVNVGQRVLEDNLVEPGRVVLTITKQIDSKIGGIWVSIKDQYIRYISLRSNEDTIWSKNFYTMIARADSLSLEYNIYGVESIGKNIVVLSGQSESVLVCKTCFNADFIRTMAKDVLDDTILWVGTDSSLLYYDPSSDTWGRFLYGRFNDLYEGPDYVYAASDSGIYKLNGQKELLYGGNTCAVYAVQSGDSITVWAVVEGKVEKNGKPIPVQPPKATCSLDVDLKGNIWCGKYWWDGTVWHTVLGLEDVSIVKSIASNEGLIYLLSESGALFRW